MKKLIYILLLFILALLALPYLASAQQSEITDVVTSIVQDGGNYYLVTTTKFSDGPDQVIPTLIGNSVAFLDFAQAAAINRQQYIAAAQKIVIEEKTLSIREFNGMDTLVQSITGGDTTLFDMNADDFFATLSGPYKVINGSTTFDATLIRLANGGVRLEQAGTGIRWTVRIFSPKNIRILNFPIGALPNATYDLYEVTPNAAGKQIFYEENKIFRLVRQ